MSDESCSEMYNNCVCILIVCIFNSNKQVFDYSYILYLTLFEKNINEFFLFQT